MGPILAFCHYWLNHNGSAACPPAACKERAGPFRFSRDRLPENAAEKFFPPAGSETNLLQFSLRFCSHFRRVLESVLMHFAFRACRSPARICAGGGFAGSSFRVLGAAPKSHTDGNHPCMHCLPGCCSLPLPRLQVSEKSCCGFQRR